MHVQAQHREREIGIWLGMSEARLFTIVSFLMANQDAALAVVEDFLIKAYVERRRSSEEPSAKQLVLLLAAAGVQRLRNGDGSRPGRFPTGRSPLERALWVLPDELRCPLVLRDMCSFSYDEIASLLGETPTTIGKRIAAARLALLRAGRMATAAGKVG